jgi:hypothetical protein
LKEAKKLRELYLMFSSGLREVGEKIYSEQITTFSFEEVEKIVEARFERTSLRDSVLRDIEQFMQQQY